MFYPSDYEVKRTKEQEIRERIQFAETHRLIQALSPRQESFVSRSLRGLLHSVGHFLLDAGEHLDALSSETRLAQKLNAK